MTSQRPRSLTLAAALALTVAVAPVLAAAASSGDEAPGERPRVLLATTLGDIVVEIFIDRAPVTAANFLEYVDRGLYEGATFYRVVTPDNQGDAAIKIEVIQGGLGIEGNHPRALPPIRHETTEETGIEHTDGTLSMARDEPGSASSEIFITLGAQPELDYGGRRNPDGEGFAAFGRVVDGMDVVRRIQARPEEGQMLREPVPIETVRRLP